MGEASRIAEALREQGRVVVKAGGEEYEVRVVTLTAPGLEDNKLLNVLDVKILLEAVSAAAHREVLAELEEVAAKALKGVGLTVPVPTPGDVSDPGSDPKPDRESVVFGSPRRIRVDLEDGSTEIREEVAEVEYLPDGFALHGPGQEMFYPSGSYWLEAPKSETSVWVTLEDRAPILHHVATAALDESGNLVVTRAGNGLTTVYSARSWVSFKEGSL